MTKKIDRTHIVETLGYWSTKIPGLEAGLGSPGKIERIDRRIRDEWVKYRGLKVHLDVHESKKNRGVIVFSPGIGGYASFYMPLLGRLRDFGFTTVGIDRPGHGWSKGRRGDCATKEAIDVIELTVAWAAERYGVPVVIMGSNIGGIHTFLAVSRNPDVAGAICHNIAHPIILPKRLFSLRHILALASMVNSLFPKHRVSIRYLLNFHEISKSPLIQEYFQKKQDPVWCWKITSRAVASFARYEEPRPWSDAEFPILIMVGENDRILTPDYTRTVIDFCYPSNTTIRILPDCGHLLFHDHLDKSLPVVKDWLKEKCGL
ncbi:alpha/beta hydrolase [Thermodesulfobacteriota bacterium]